MGKQEEADSVFGIGCFSEGGRIFKFGSTGKVSKKIVWESFVAFLDSAYGTAH